ncbi:MULTISPECIES: PAS-domain containing protein [unclassified Novosphingobium]|uniref:hybrid sensor histidine kinase/response regulator n=1 Tax=unclassified Novosphingobium TaxID=2644732 RepID=UPI0025F6C0A8|nr:MULTISPECIES: PAS-domain containing protein [unclassified Novosphingobium]HQV02250.1 PAS-domain containing protein [Novosphingobium sp.]
MDLRSATFATLALIAALFTLATLVERRSAVFQARPAWRHLAYTLALGVYCSSWTFYGAVGSAVRDGWNYLPIYLAPILFLLFAPRFIERLSEAVAMERATTVSDFIAARFGHDVGVARLVTMIALLGSIPYVALQLRSIGYAMSIVSGQQVTFPAMVIAAILLALFAILFGARRYEVAGRSEGLVYAIGVDSLFKLLALAAVAILAISVLQDLRPAELNQALGGLAEQFAPGRIALETMVIALISATAIIALPRQFHMGLVEAREPSDLSRARPGLIGYLGLMAITVLPISLAGISVLGTAAPPDSFVLALPAARDDALVLILALLGGVSAAASMAIVDATALATMISNHLVFPALLRDDVRRRAGALGARMLLVRRLSVLAIMLLALAWAMLVSASNSLASIGLIAFAAMAQFTPHLILAANGGGRDPLAARASLTAGLVLWAYTLALPPILPPAWLGQLRGSPADPLQLFGVGSASPLVHGVFWSLGVNLLVLFALSAKGIRAPALPRFLRAQRTISDMPSLVELTASFIGRERAEQEFQDVAIGQPVDRRSARHAQELIARVVGVSSARTLVTSALAGGTMSLPEVARLLDERGQNLRFSRQLLAATFENIDAGISVVDAEMNLVAWNSRYLELFDYPSGMVRTGLPVADLLQHNAQRGDFGPGDSEFHVQKRLGHLRRGLEHSFERRRNDGRVIKTVGGPMPGGGYVMSFTDITEEARVREELRRTLDELESRVAERTSELSEVNRLLAQSDADKTRFLAAASHDLLQPLHAARLFTAALDREVDDKPRQLVHRVESAIIAAEDLLRALLDISKLDAGGVQPRPEPVNLKEFLVDLTDSLRPLAEERGLTLRLGPAPGSVVTDPALLRSVMQNFLTNAVRYTRSGGIVVGVRRRGQNWRIDVIDSGVGIAPDKLDAVFGEFTRLGDVEEEGLGLGLALVQRIARLLGGRISVASKPGRGSRFSFALPVGDAVIGTPRPAASLNAEPARSLAVLVIDNDPRIVEATSALLQGLGHRPLGASGRDQALAHCGAADAILADYQLDDGEEGLSVIEAIWQARPGLPARLVTAESGEAMAARARQMGVSILAKPVDPAMIARFLAEVSMLEVEP